MLYLPGSNKSSRWVQTNGLAIPAGTSLDEKDSVHEKDTQLCNEARLHERAVRNLHRGLALAQVEAEAFSDRTRSLAGRNESGTKPYSAERKARRTGSRCLRCRATALAEKALRGKSSGIESGGTELRCLNGICCFAESKSSLMFSNFP